MKKLVLLLTVFMSACISNAQEAVDLGLSVKWATMNVGASTPYEEGGLYAWGETETKERYTYHWSTYFDLDKFEVIPNGKGWNVSFKVFTSDKIKMSGTKYDVATVKWGGNWRMPTVDEFKELLNKCDIREDYINGKYMYVATGPNGNSIILPPVHRDGTNGYHAPGNYWTATLQDNRGDGYGKHDFWCAYSVNFGGVKNSRIETKERFTGFAVRPVMSFRNGEYSYYKEKKEKEDNEEFEYILKSGTRNEKVLLARDYSRGNGVKKDYSKVFKLYKSLADKGDVEFKIDIAKMYEKGEGVEKSFEKAAEAYFELAHVFGNAEGMNFFIKNRQQVIDNPKLAELMNKAYVPHGTDIQYNNNPSWKTVCLIGAAATGNLTAAVELADKLFAMKEIKPAIELYEKAAEDGSTDAMYKLGKIYLDSSSGGFMDIEKGIMWYTKAADTGHSDARLELGTFYKNGIHVKKDKKKAKIYLQ